MAVDAARAEGERSRRLESAFDGHRPTVIHLKRNLQPAGKQLKQSATYHFYMPAPHSCCHTTSRRDDHATCIAVRCVALKWTARASRSRPLEKHPTTGKQQVLCPHRHSGSPALQLSNSPAPGGPFEKNPFAGPPFP